MNKLPVTCGLSLSNFAKGEVALKVATKEENADHKQTHFPT
jgi:hypothetical protein